MYMSVDIVWITGQLMTITEHDSVNTTVQVSFPPPCFNEIVVRVNHRGRVVLINTRTVVCLPFIENIRQCS